MIEVRMGSKRALAARPTRPTRPATPAPGEQASLPRRREGVTFEQLPDGSGVLIDPATGSTCAINATACEVWRLCDGRRTAEGIADALLERYEASREEVMASIAALLAQLRGLDLLA